MSRHRPQRRVPPVSIPVQKEDAPVRVRPDNYYPLPLGMEPAPPLEPRLSKVIDLGNHASKYKGWKVVYNLDIDIVSLSSMIELLTTRAQDLEDEDIPVLERARLATDRTEKAKEFLQKTLLYWNFTKKYADGRVEQLPQPQDGGLEKLNLEPELFQALMAAFNRAYRPDPNS